MNKDIVTYNNNVESPELKAVCEKLAAIIQLTLPEGKTSKVWHAAPVWFINDNPIVGYNVTKKGRVNLLFWSGQSFKESGLSAEGSFKAAEMKYDTVSDIDEAKLTKWLQESAVTMWNYRDIRKNRGIIDRL
jgi:hypothetical protein